jgi:hypothetical protein
MDLGEVVEINHPDLALTTPSPQADNILRLNCGRIHPSLNKEGKHWFSIFIYSVLLNIYSGTEFLNDAVIISFNFVLLNLYIVLPQK